MDPHSLFLSRAQELASSMVTALANLALMKHALGVRMHSMLNTSKSIKKVTFSLRSECQIMSMTVDKP